MATRSKSLRRLPSSTNLARVAWNSLSVPRAILGAATAGVPAEDYFTPSGTATFPTPDRRRPLRGGSSPAVAPAPAVPLQGGNAPPSLPLPPVGAAMPVPPATAPGVVGSVPTLTVPTIPETVMLDA